MAQNLKKAERKEQIKKTAIRLITKNGYKNTSVQNIVDEMNYSVGGFYNCYESKEELFKEILQDANQYKYNQIDSFREKVKHLDKKEILVQGLLDKLLIYNDYKKLFCSLVVEMKDNQNLKDFYFGNVAAMNQQFVEFCKKEGFPEYEKVINDEIALFINSIIIGVDMFNAYDNKAYRTLLEEMITAYFEKINLEGVSCIL